jgi:hypothetical protein
VKRPKIPQRVFTIGWVVWLAGFGVWEGLALADENTGDTLSEHVWSVADVFSGQWTFERYFLAAAMVWLTGHFVFGWWAGRKEPEQHGTPQNLPERPGAIRKHPGSSGFVRDGGAGKRSEGEQWGN